MKKLVKILKSIPDWPERIWRYNLSPLWRRVCSWLRERFPRRAELPASNKPLLLPRGYGKPVHVERTNGTYNDYISISEAARVEGVERAVIQNALRNGKDKAGNIWKHAHPMAWTRGMQRWPG